MPLADGDVLRVAVNISLPDNVVAQNVFYYEVNDPTPDNPSDSQVLTAIDSELTALYTDIEDAMTDDVTVLDADVEKIEWETDHWETKDNIGIVTLAIVGDSTGEMVPHGVAATVTANTSRPQTRARKFFPGFSEAFVSESDWTGSAITWLTNAAAEWISNRGITGAAELIPIVVGMSGDSAGLIYPLLGVVINSIAGYQRRRKPGVGS